MNQLKALFIFALFALMITGIFSSPSFLRLGDLKTSGFGDCLGGEICGGVCCLPPQMCIKGRFYECT